MTTLLWVTDPHFNFLTASAWGYFKHQLAFWPKEVPLVITGDINEVVAQPLLHFRHKRSEGVVTWHISTTS